jgi:hypothetical protein
MKRLAPVVLIVALLGVSRPGAADGGMTRALAFLVPTIRLSSDEQTTLGNDRAIARVLSVTRDDISLFGITPVRASGSELIRASRNIARLRQSPQVLAIGRFSDPPRLSDLDKLTLDQGDVDAIPQCRPGNCDLKLSDAEMAALQAVMRQPGGRARVQQAFREVIFARVQAYLEGGLAALQPLHDHDEPVNLQEQFLSVLHGSSSLMSEAPWLVPYLAGPPVPAPPNVSWYLYWSTEKYAGRPVVRVAHLLATELPDGPVGPQAVLVEKQLFALHYINALIGVTTLSAAGGTDPNFLVYANRSRVDFLGGFFGPIKRTIVRHEVEGYLVKILAFARRRLEATD